MPARVVRAAAALVLISMLSACARLDPAPPSRLASSSIILSEEPWTYQGRAGVLIETPRVRLSTTLPDGALRDRLPIMLEHMLAAFDRLGSAPATTSIDVLVFADAQTWREAVGQRFGLATAPGLQRAAASSRGVAMLHDVGEEDTLRLAAHEAWHARAQRALVSRLPVSIDEAIAVWAEGVRWDQSINLPVHNPWRNPARASSLAALVSTSRLGSLRDHVVEAPRELTASGPRLEAYYARAWVLGLLLIESGDAALRRSLTRVLDQAADGSLAWNTSIPVSEQWESAFGLPFDVLDARWQALAHDLARGHTGSATLRSGNSRGGRENVHRHADHTEAARSHEEARSVGSSPQGRGASDLSHRESAQGD